MPSCPKYYLYLILNFILLQALQSLSLADSRLRQRGSVLVNALGSNTCLRKVDLSGNLLEDPGAKMLSKALQINTTLRCVFTSAAEEEECSSHIRVHFSPCETKEKLC